jgi:hypothetical protein
LKDTDKQLLNIDIKQLQITAEKLGSFYSRVFFIRLNIQTKEYTVLSIQVWVSVDFGEA